VPPTDISELIDGDLAIYILGDIGDVENPLPEKVFGAAKKYQGALYYGRHLSYPWT